MNLSPFNIIFNAIHHVALLVNNSAQISKNLEHLCNSEFNTDDFKIKTWFKSLISLSSKFKALNKKACKFNTKNYKRYRASLLHLLHCNLILTANLKHTVNTEGYRYDATSNISASATFCILGSKIGEVKVRVPMVSPYSHSCPKTKLVELRK